MIGDIFAGRFLAGVEGADIRMRLQFVLNLEIPVPQISIENLNNLSYHASWILENKPSLALSAAFSLLIS